MEMIMALRQELWAKLPITSTRIGANISLLTRMSVDETWKVQRPRVQSGVMTFPIKNPGPMF